MANRWKAILFSTYYEDDKKLKNVEVNERTPRFQDFYISNIFCSNAKTAISIIGLPEMPVSKLHFSNMVISAAEPVIAIEAADMAARERHPVDAVGRETPLQLPVVL